MSLKDALPVPVYRKNDPLQWSPCVFADEKPCGICVAHRLRKKLRTPCMRLRTVEPAYTIPAKSAVLLVEDGLAEIVLDGSAIRLLFSKFAHLRDASLRIDAEFLMRYATGDKRTRAAIQFGWDGIALAGGANCERLTMVEPEFLQATAERVRLFT